MKIQWISELSTDQVRISPKSLRENQIIPSKMKFHFGAWDCEINIDIDPRFSDDVIGLPQAWREKFTFPDALTYQLLVEDNNLHLGPLIALISFSKHDKITADNLNHHLDYFLQFGTGMLIICAVDGIDTKKKLIKGYYYYTDGTVNNWKTGVFPYPDAVYNRTKVSKEIFDDLSQMTNNRIFNSFSNGSFNKWELWQRLTPVPELQNHLPHTIPLTNIQSLNGMIDLHGFVYLKPSGSTLSKGIIKVCRTKNKNGYVLLYPNRKKGGKGTIQHILVDRKKIRRWIQRLNRKKYIVQQAISMKKYEQMPIDFRVIMQKNKNNKWGCTGIFSKYGKKGSIITNFSTSGRLLSGAESLQLAFQMNEQQAQNKLNKLAYLSHLICRTFDKYGLYGDLGIDLVVDEFERVWILEVNTLDTYHRFPLHLNNKQLYEQVIKNPLEYAKFLSGFRRSTQIL
ncbi:YheC/YheD family endospore coat-associated protein [Bacillus sp. Marseille-P3661]|uniref:YheC/YheD family endospore coat-associated protein n=1 Tax=Bacillus sp. Marseille-P3661 TaxID=1936234 RepID=UPI000C821FE6|nr:YheC/YheD family protein [Bacillus sp. Marseille-P3661]